jgi:hypothetical protein
MFRVTRIYTDAELTDGERRLITDMLAYTPSEVRVEPLEAARKPAASEQIVIVRKGGDDAVVPLWANELGEPDVFTLRTDPLRIVASNRFADYEVRVVPPIKRARITSTVFPINDLAAFTESGNGLLPTLPVWLALNLLLDDPAEGSDALRLFAPRFTVKRLGVEAFSIRFFNGELTLAYKRADGYYVAEIDFCEPLGVYASSWLFDGLYTVQAALTDGADYPVAGQTVQYASRTTTVEIEFGACNES